MISKSYHSLKRDQIKQESLKNSIKITEKDNSCLSDEVNKLNDKNHYSKNYGLIEETDSKYILVHF